MTTLPPIQQTLIEKMEDAANKTWGVRKDGIEDAIAIIRQHQAEQPQDVVTETMLLTMRYWANASLAAIEHDDKSNAKFYAENAINHIQNAIAAMNMGEQPQDVVERVAKAIGSTEGWSSEDYDNPDKMPPHIYDKFNKKAKAAIAAMGESSATIAPLSVETAQPITPANCPSCNGNDADKPCAYPSEGKPGCPRDERLQRSEISDNAYGAIFSAMRNKLGECNEYVLDTATCAAYEAIRPYLRTEPVSLEPLEITVKGKDGEPVKCVVKEYSND